ncbi:hypothetical protein BLNAU_3597 [Blattamonas nauphoetae]|uniref:Uncharacterized protein n=1 Tax=Blattamonas nauphoetae TaxID=2049346 RepID=A0ABQ9YCP8_9EUKA|nr:hypothetical protein BLNAU_3597 [Blattamonas nauphoetae]
MNQTLLSLESQFRQKSDHISDLFRKIEHENIAKPREENSVHLHKKIHALKKKSEDLGRRQTQISEKKETLFELFGLDMELLSHGITALYQVIGVGEPDDVRRDREDRIAEIMSLIQPDNG